MSHQDLIERLIPDVANGLDRCLKCPVGPNGMAGGFMPAGKRAVVEVLDDLVAVLFPGCHGHEVVAGDTMYGYLRSKLSTAARGLRELVRRANEYECRMSGGPSDNLQPHADEIVADFFRGLPELQTVLQADVRAAYEGDPAAKSTMEVVLSYPGIYAVAVYRLAHALHVRGVPLIPRIMSEHAHSVTGIDIHPGATIGPGFFIDHGTGVVIGETCTIGRNVKLYQGVTLGALSFEKDSEGRLVKGVKRHPDVEDNVVIYAGATILGGDTRIGANSEIGGNVWLIHSVPPNSKVYNQQPKPLIRPQ